MEGSTRGQGGDGERSVGQMALVVPSGPHTLDHTAVAWVSLLSQKELGCPLSGLASCAQTPSHPLSALVSSC